MNSLAEATTQTIIDFRRAIIVQCLYENDFSSDDLILIIGFIEDLLNKEI